MTTYDKSETIALLARLKDGDKPLQSGDTFHHPEHGAVVVSKVYGWQDAFRLVNKRGANHFEPCRRLSVSFLRPGKKKAEKVSIMPGGNQGEQE
jgi:hypothetical protein